LYKLEPENVAGEVSGLLLLQPEQFIPPNVEIKSQHSFLLRTAASNSIRIMQKHSLNSNKIRWKLLKCVKKSVLWLEMEGNQQTIFNFSSYFQKD
jgi:hypothetical protein